MGEARTCLRLEAVTKRFGPVRALRSVDLDVARGECLALLGPNGAGKTTLLRILAGLMRPSSGRILLDGRELSAHGVELKARLGLVGHHTMLYDALSARENLRFHGRLHAVPQLQSRIDQLLRGLDLQERADEPVGSLSRGLQQRVAVARALLHDPELLLLDEPHSGLDESAARALGTLLDVVRRRGRTIVLVTHELGRALALSDRVVVLRGGKVVLDEASRSLDAATFGETYLRCIRGDEAKAAQGAAS